MAENKNGESKLRFTEEEYCQMVREIMSEHQRHDMLCTIVEKTLRGFVGRSCYGDMYLRGKQHEEDLMQELKLHFMLRVANEFLFKDDATEPCMDMQYFKNWLFFVAGNFIINYRNKLKGYDRDRKLDNKHEGAVGRVNGFGTEVPFPRIESPIEDVHGADALQEAFDHCWSYKYSVHKPLTWLAQFVLVLSFGATAIEANHIIVETLTDKTLFEVYDTIMTEVQYIQWLEIDVNLTKNIRQRLIKKGKDGKPVGDCVYGSLYMKKGGLASVSDWVNRMTKYILLQFAKKQ